MSNDAEAPIVDSTCYVCGHGPHLYGGPNRHEPHRYTTAAEASAWATRQPQGRQPVQTIDGVSQTYTD